MRNDEKSKWLMTTVLMLIGICSVLVSIPVISHDGSPVITNWNPRYTVFGPVSTPSINAPSFATRRRDPTGLYFFGARYYDPKTGLFTQPDPARLADSRNLYAFCANNPLLNFDPDGRLSAQNMASVDNSDQNVSAQYGSYGTQNWEYEQNHLATMAQTLRPVGELMAGDYADVAYLGVDIYDFVQDPSWQGAGAIAVGVGLVALPVISKPLANAAEGVVEGVARNMDGVTPKKLKTVLGSSQDVAPFKGKPGYNVLEMDTTLPLDTRKGLNIQWLDEAIDRGDDIILKTDPFEWERFMREIGKESFYNEVELPRLLEKGMIGDVILDY
ncbi:MAG: RHS repeat-associated core domain-containing protein [Spartobacteria bacterium]|nr:RHS repeat-associated core domain-containing protein [Spartobacteria bacterium]